ncbi:MAG: hypothetical protein PVH52_06420 [bacterium]|jgi:hypothetical protein
MRTLLILVGICLLATSVYAYDDTLIKHETEVGGFFTIVTKNTEIKQTFNLMVGGQAALLVNHNWAFGVGGYGVVNDPIPEGLKEEGLIKLRGYYGGFLLEYIAWPEKVVHVAIPVLVGAGKVEYKGSYRDSKTGEDSDTYFIAEPGLDLEFNITRFWRMDLGATYRYVSGCELGDVTDNDLSGLAANLTFKFGKF